MALARPKLDRRGKLAEKARRLLDDDELRALLRPTEEELAALDRIGRGVYVRGAAAIVSLFKTRLEFSLSKPPQQHQVAGSVTINWKSLSPEELDERLGGG